MRNPSLAMSPNLSPARLFPSLWLFLLTLQHGCNWEMGRRELSGVDRVWGRKKQKAWGLWAIKTRQASDFPRLRKGVCLGLRPPS